MDDNNGGIISKSFDWLKHPFNSQGSALNWTLFVGLIIVIIWFWGHVLLTITNE